VLTHPSGAGARGNSANRGALPVHAAPGCPREDETQHPGGHADFRSRQTTACICWPVVRPRVRRSGADVVSRPCHTGQPVGSFCRRAMSYGPVQVVAESSSDSRSMVFNSRQDCRLEVSNLRPTVARLLVQPDNRLDHELPPRPIGSTRPHAPSPPPGAHPIKALTSRNAGQGLSRTCQNAHGQRS
jgi:hypothetical protein